MNGTLFEAPHYNVIWTINYYLNQDELLTKESVWQILPFKEEVNYTILPMNKNWATSSHEKICLLSLYLDRGASQTAGGKCRGLWDMRRKEEKKEMRRLRRHSIFTSIVYTLQLYKRHLPSVCCVCAGCSVTDNLHTGSVKYYVELRSLESVLRRYDCCSVDINTPSFPQGGERQSSAISHRRFITDDVTPGMDHLTSPILACVTFEHAHHHTYALPGTWPFLPLSLTLSLHFPCFSET